MAFHTEAELRKLGEDVAKAAEGAYLREQADQAHKSGASGHGFSIPMPGDRFYTHYPELYASFATPDPNGMQRALNTLGSMSFALKHDFPILDPGGTDVPVPDISGGVGDLAGKDTPVQISQNVAYKIQGWHGHAKDAFQEKILTKFEEKVDNQVAAVNMLAVSLAMHMHLRKKLNDDVWDIGRKSIETFDKVERFNVGDAIQITLLVAVAAGTAWSVWRGGLGSVSAKDAASVVTAFNNIRMSPHVARTLSHDSASQADSSMKSILGEAAKSYHDQEKEIVAAVDHLGAGLRDPATNSLFVFPAPPEVDSLDEQGNNLPTLESEFTPGR
jgi:ribosomal protein L21E